MLILGKGWFPDEERCVLVGAALFGEEGYGRRLQELAHELGLGARVDFRGFRPDIWPELRRMDMLVHASLSPEPFGQVVIEGMAGRVPVIAAAAGGPAEVITDDVNGVLYPMGDQSALEAAMRRLADDPQLRQRLVEAALTSVAAYRPDLVATRVEDLYREVLERTRST